MDINEALEVLNENRHLGHSSWVACAEDTNDVCVSYFPDHLRRTRQEAIMLATCYQLTAVVPSSYPKMSGCPDDEDVDYRDKGNYE